MKLIDKSFVDNFSENDWILERLATVSEQVDERLTCQKWLLESAAKRAVYAELYGDLLESRGLRVLDIGGGFTGFTRELASRHRYALVDMMAHDGDATERLRGLLGENLRAEDWASGTDEESYDVIVANDLFPNVDQRLKLFLKRFLPRTRNLRLSLTYYDDERWYTTKRLNAEEILTMVAWDGAQTRAVLSKFEDRIVNGNLELFARACESAYPNGRAVCTLEFNGGLA